ncbi:hypothetical protein D3C76_1268390 [compost metagenome]
MGFRPGNAVLFQVSGGDDAVWLQPGAEPLKVVTGVDTVGLGGLEQHGVPLLLGPAGHVLGADVAGKDFVAAHLGQRVVTETRLAVVVHPLLRRGGDTIFHQCSEGLAAERRHAHADTGDQATLQEGAPGNITVGHA